MHQGAPSIQRWYESVPLLGWLGVSAPLRPWDLATRGTFEPLLIARGFPRGLASGVGWLPRPPPPWRGVAPAPPSRAVNPFQGLFISFSSVSSRPIKAVWASLCLHAPVQRQGFTGVSRFVPVCRRNGLPCFFGAAIAGARTRRPSRAGQSSQSSAGSASMRAVGQEEEQWCVIHVGVRECLQQRSAVSPWSRWAWIGRIG